MLRLCFYGCLVAASVSALDLSSFAEEEDQSYELAECDASGECENQYSDELAFAQIEAEDDVKKAVKELAGKKKNCKKTAAESKCERIKKDSKALKDKNKVLQKTVKAEKRRNKKKTKKLTQYKRQAKKQEKKNIAADLKAAQDKCAGDVAKGAEAKKACEDKLV